MDAIDEKLIFALRENARASTAQLARLVGRSRTSVQSRIERLEKQGVIVGYGVRLAPEHEMGAVRAHVMIKVGPKEARAVSAHVLRWLNDERAYAEVCRELAELRQRVAEPGACERAAEYVLHALAQRRLARAA